MDIQSQFKDLNFNEDEKPKVKPQKLIEENLPEKTEDFDESDKIIKDLESRLATIRNFETSEEEEEQVEENVYAYGQTWVEKLQPFIIPICLTLFAIIFAGLFLYFFSKSRVEKRRRQL
jgi:hypothetical protein